MYRLLRRCGSILFFIAALHGENILARSYWQLFPSNRMVNSKFVVLAILLLEFRGFATAKLILNGLDWIENATEWQSAVPLTVVPVLTWLFWLHRGLFRFQITENIVTLSHEHRLTVWYSGTNDLIVKSRFLV